MNPDRLVLGLIEYVVFLLSTTCHEASHALVAKWGGDLTAFEGGQVSLNPTPHIRREPFGMVVMPLLGFFLGTGIIGWASAPYDTHWQMRYPKRAALMSLASPAANFSLALIAGILMKIGLTMGYFHPGAYVVSGGGSDVLDGVALVLSTFFSLNILLGMFNLLPIPPLDGYTVLGLFLPDRLAIRLQEFRLRSQAFTIIALLLGWRILERYYGPVFGTAVRILYSGHSLQ